MLYTKTLALALIASAEAFTLGGMGRTPQRTAGVRMAERVQLDPAVLERYTNLPVKGKVQAELHCAAQGLRRSKQAKTTTEEMLATD